MQLVGPNVRSRSPSRYARLVKRPFRACLYLPHLGPHPRAGPWLLGRDERYGCRPGDCMRYERPLQPSKAAFQRRKMGRGVLDNPCTRPLAVVVAAELAI